MNKKYLYALMTFLSLCCIAGIALFEPIPQDTGYHNFADQRVYFSIPNFMDVASNIFFLFAGGLGIKQVLAKRCGVDAGLCGILCIFYFSIILVSFGSSYYHLNPNNATLIWDRLPMTIGFMSLFCVIIGERISIHAARLLFLPLVGLGLSSVLYWFHTE